MIQIPPESYIHDLYYNPFHAKVIVGKYTSIAEGFRITIASHPSLTHNTVSSFPFREKRGLKDYPTCTVGGKITIGNDVWIGCNVHLIGEINIGDGAIIGASSVVAKDVEPYSIVVGNPVKIIRYRFNDLQIKALLKIKWWNWDFATIKKRIKDFKNIGEFIEKYE